MKKNDLERLKESKISSMMAQTVTPGRFGREAANLTSRREQRKLDQAKGLIPFAVKLHGDLIKRLHELVQSRGIGLNELTAELIQRGLTGSQSGLPERALASPQTAAPANPVRSEAVVPPQTISPAPEVVAPKPPKMAKPARAPAPKKPQTKAKAPVAKAKKPVAAKPKPKKKSKKTR